MLHGATVSVIAGVVTAIWVTQTATAAGVGFPATRLSISLGVEPASFFAMPYPYGYQWHRHPQCVRRVPQQTYNGDVVWCRVWICN